MDEQEFVLTDKGQAYLQRLRENIDVQKSGTRESADHAILGFIESGWPFGPRSGTQSSEVRSILKRLFEAGYIESS